MGDGVGEEEVERRAAALAGDVLDDACEAVAADEERERLVLVRRPGHQLVEQERRCRHGDRADPEPERVGVEKRARRGGERAGARGGFGGLCHRASGRIFAGRLAALMPIYEYRCPNGHTFELFQKMSDAPAESCETCGASPVEKVLFPVAVHYKGSGFYSTDYGRGSRKGASKDGDGGGSGEKSDSSEKKEPAKDSGSGDKKAAAAD